MVVAVSERAPIDSAKGLLRLFKPRSRDFESSVTGELPVLYRVARRLGATAEESEDLVQTTLIKAFKNWDRFDGRHLRSWLVRILRNERLGNLRTARPEVEWDESVETIAGTQDFWSQIHNKLEAQAIINALQDLPEPYRLAVQLCDVEQMTYEQAAEAMAVPIGTVRSRLFRARAELRSRLGANQ